MTADRYADTGRRWALGAELVYAPIGAELVATCPHPLGGRTVLDAGASGGAGLAGTAARYGQRRWRRGTSWPPLSGDGTSAASRVTPDRRSKPLRAGQLGRGW